MHVYERAISRNIAPGLLCCVTAKGTERTSLGLTLSTRPALIRNSSGEAVSLNNVRSSQGATDILLTQRPEDVDESSGAESQEAYEHQRRKAAVTLAVDLIPRAKTRRLSPRRSDVWRSLELLSG